ncbi:unnamed protein product [Cylicostephanus goldi]|uniref:Uncharacterized protein n=1 Tax=Cylicostephanus goldi TaxID=71465 RepID=A0A3P6RGA5_CYLGO|nr:unnamed protein product [Cylicostephanus goldi]
MQPAFGEKLPRSLRQQIDVLAHGRGCQAACSNASAEYLSIDRELELRSDLRTPISPYSDAYWSYRKNELDSRELAQKVTAQDIESYVGSGMVNTGEISEQHYDPYATKKVSGEAYVKYPNTVPRSESGKRSEPEMSDSETLLPQPSLYSESDATLVQDESLHYDVSRVEVEKFCVASPSGR